MADNIKNNSEINKSDLYPIAAIRVVGSESSVICKFIPLWQLLKNNKFSLENKEQMFEALESFQEKFKDINIGVDVLDANAWAKKINNRQTFIVDLGQSKLTSNELDSILSSNLGNLSSKTIFSSEANIMNIDVAAQVTKSISATESVKYLQTLDKAGVMAKSILNKKELDNTLKSKKNLNIDSNKAPILILSTFTAVHLDNSINHSEGNKLGSWGLGQCGLLSVYDIVGKEFYEKLDLSNGEGVNSLVRELCFKLKSGIEEMPIMSGEKTFLGYSKDFGNKAWVKDVDGRLIVSIISPTLSIRSDNWNEVQDLSWESGIKKLSDLIGSKCSAPLGDFSELHGVNEALVGMSVKELIEEINGCLNDEKLINSIDENIHFSEIDKKSIKNFIKLSDLGIKINDNKSTSVIERNFNI